MLSFFLLQVSTTDTVINTLNTVANQVPARAPLSLIDLYLKGGWIMHVILLLSLVAVYIFIERLLAVHKASKEENNFMNNIRDFIHNGKVEAAIMLCKHKNSPISRMIEKGLSRLGKPLSDINTAIENVGNLEVSKLEKNMALLSTVAGAAPMLGFLGTVTGMVRAFYDMSMAGNNIDIELLSRGIYEAMITTVGGLIVGIMAYICHNILVARIDKIVFTLEAKATEFMDLLNEPAK